jgi:hypothetical protein
VPDCLARGFATMGIDVRPREGISVGHSRLGRQAFAVASRGLLFASTLPVGQTAP